MKFPDIYPYSKRLVTPTVMGKGAMTPLGVVVHYTGDRDLERVHRTCRSSGLGYHLVIDRDGTVYQWAYFGLRVAHAGNAEWLGVSPNRHFIAIGLASWGHLKPVSGPVYRAWNGDLLEGSDVVQRASLHMPPTTAWDSATPAQEARLERVLRWLISHGIPPGMICGHDECALPRGRKVDPGGVLALTMEGIRQHLTPPKSPVSA